MHLSMNINYDVQDANKEVEAILEEIIGEEARSFAETVRQRLAAEGVKDIHMSTQES